MENSFVASLPKHLQQYVRNQVKQGVHKTEQEVVKEALESKIAQERRLYELLEEGLASGDPVEITDELLDEILQDAFQRQKLAKPKNVTP